MGVEFIDENRTRNQVSRPRNASSGFGAYQFSQNGFPQNNITSGGLVGWVMKKGWAKNTKQANLLLLFVALIFFIISFAVPAFLGKEERIKIYREDIDTTGMSEAELDEVYKNFPSKYR